MRFINSKGKEVKCATIDGYAFGDRILEDVKFECHIIDEEIKVIGVLPHHRKYFETLNTEYWLAAAQQYVDANFEEPIFNCELVKI